MQNDSGIYNKVEQENDKGEIQGKASENLEILDTVNLDIAKLIEDKLREGLVDNENEEYDITVEGDLRLKSCKQKLRKRHKRR